MSRKGDWIFWLTVLLVLVLLLWLLSDILLPFVGGIALAYVQAPLADRPERIGVGRTSAALLIVSAVVAAIVVLMLLVLPLLSTQALALAAAIPRVVTRLQAILADLGSPWLRRLLDGNPTEMLPTLMTRSPGAVTELMRSLWSGGKAMASFVSLIIIMPVVTFYLICDWHRMIDTLDSLIPTGERETVRGLARKIDGVVSGFLRGQAGVSAIAALYYVAALSLAGLDFSLLIGVLSGVLAIIPYIGPVAAAAIGIGMALQQFWPQWMPIATVSAIFMVGQFVTDNILGPRLVGANVGLHPVWLIFAMAAFGYLFGIVGLLLAVPVAAAIAVLLRFWLDRYRNSRLYCT